jgi:hypothetical protein
MNALRWLQEWYIQNCDGDWEHCYGIKIGTLDNPGWFIDIDLVDTYLEDEKFEKIVLQRSENDWIHCHIVDGVFKGGGGPLNLEEIIEIFQNWCFDKG